MFVWAAASIAPRWKPADDTMRPVFAPRSMTTGRKAHHVLSCRSRSVLALDDDHVRRARGVDRVDVDADPSQREGPLALGCKPAFAQDGRDAFLEWSCQVAGASPSMSGRMEPHSRSTGSSLSTLDRVAAAVCNAWEGGGVRRGMWSRRSCRALGS